VLALKWEDTTMQLGIHLPHIGRKAGPDSIRRTAMQAEELGFADVWVSEHIIVPKDGGYPPSANFWDPVLTLTWAAAATKRVRLGTSVLVLPMRHPLPLAKELATLQNLSQGRLILGAGVGWLEAEFNALGVPFKERGRRMDEGIALMKAVWSQDPVTFPARWIPAVVENMRTLPQPEVPIPIWIGGSSDAAIKRALRLDGWHGSRVRPEAAAEVVKRFRAERPDDGFTISLRININAANVDDTRAALAAYAEAGVQHVMAAPEDRDIETYLKTVERFRRAGDGL
jgi:probable F420-dependent oxidoreductase